MKKLFKHPILLLFPILLSAVLSCQRQEGPDVSKGSLVFSVREEIPDYQTKAAEIYRSSDATPLQGTSIAVWAYNFPSQTSAISAYLVDGGSAGGAVKAVHSSTSGEWETDVPYNSSKRDLSYYSRWFAVAPWSVLGSGATLAAFADGTAPTLSYTVPAAAADQHDLMTAVSGTHKVKGDEVVPLTFTHALTGVRIMADKSAVVSAATISGVYDTGTLDLMSGEWDSHSMSVSSPSFVLDLSSADLWDKSGTYDVIKDASTLLLLPQWLPSGAKLSMTVNGVAVEVDLSGHKWLPGKLVTYYVQDFENDYHISIEENYASAISLTSGVATDVARIRSYLTPQGGGIENPSAWIVRGIYSTRSLAEAGGSSDLSWNAEIVGASSTVGADHDVLRVTASHAAAVSSPVNAILQATAPRGSESKRWNLSNPNGGEDSIRESANTYIINAPGYYRLPLVMGNGVKGGAPNTSAYKLDGTSRFMDYKGNLITNPYLHMSGTPQSAEIVWTEVSGMVEDLAIQNDTENGLYWLTFHIQASKIAQGCTVVSVKDNAGTVMWSWLLWTTDYEPGSGDIACTYSSGGDQVHFMPRNLGWSVDGSITMQAGGDGWVRVESQQDPDAYALVYVHLPAQSSSVGHAGHGPFYQWGRMDALPHSGDLWATVNSGSKQPLDLIQNPGKHMMLGYYPFTNDGGMTGYFWWSASATKVGHDLATVKTVYDPCPAGYTVPRHNAFNGFSATASTWDNTNKGYTFNTGYLTAGSGTVYFPAGGRRAGTPSNATLVSPSVGQYWTAVTQGGNTARRFSFEDGAVYLPRTNDSLGGGDKDGFFSKAGEHYIRPAREE